MGSDRPHDLIDRWDRQQAAYSADREGRFTAMLEVLAEFRTLLAEGRRGSQAPAASEPTTLGLRSAALARAGFVESGTVWQLMDDFVVYGLE